MIDLNTLYHVNKVLRNELTENLKNSPEIKDQFSRLCSIIGELGVLIKEVENGSRIKKPNKMS